MGHIGPEAKEAVPVLLKQLTWKSGDKFEAESLRNSAAAAPGRIGAATPDVVPALVAALNDEMSDVRGRTIAALVMIGEPARVTIPRLVEVMNSDESKGIRYQAADAITRLDPCNPPRPVLEKELRGDSAEYEEAIGGLARMKAAQPKPVEKAP